MLLVTSSAATCASDGANVEDRSSGLTHPSSISPTGTNTQGWSAESCNRHQNALEIEEVLINGWPIHFFDMQSTTTQAEQSVHLPSSLLPTQLPDNDVVGEINLPLVPLQSQTPDLQLPKMAISRMNTHVCRICKNFSGTRKALGQHVNMRHNELPCRQVGCDKMYADERSRARHYETKHKVEQGYYQCHCGKKDQRKDNHKRHLKSCKKDCQLLYRCACGEHDIVEKEGHIEHLKKCMSAKRWSTRAGKNVSASC